MSVAIAATAAGIPIHRPHVQIERRSAGEGKARVPMSGAKPSSTNPRLASSPVQRRRTSAAKNRKPSETIASAIPAGHFHFGMPKSRRGNQERRSHPPRRRSVAQSRSASNPLLQKIVLQIAMSPIAIAVPMEAVATRENSDGLSDSQDRTAGKRAKQPATNNPPVPVNLHAMSAPGITKARIAETAVPARAETRSQTTIRAGMEVSE